MEKALGTFKLGCWVIAFIVYTLCIYGTAFSAGWYKGVADTLKPMFFQQSQQVGDIKGPESPIQFPANKEKVRAQ